MISWKLSTNNNWNFVKELLNGWEKTSTGDSTLSYFLLLDKSRFCAKIGVFSGKKLRMIFWEPCMNKKDTWDYKRIINCLSNDTKSAS